MNPSKISAHNEDEELFALASLYLECEEITQISQQEYEKLADLKDIVIDAITFERCYAVAVENYLELREALSSLRTPTGNVAADYSSALACFNLVDRRILNFCCTARAYTDHIKQLFKKAEFDFTSLAISSFNSMYDSSVHYRIMEAFRNHVQHSRLALSSITYPDAGSDADTKSAVLFARKSDIATNTSFKQTVLKELPENIDLGACAAKYMADIGAVHLALRNALAPCVSNAREALRQAIGYYRKKFDLTHPVVVATIVRGRLRERHLLSNPWEPLIDELRNANSQIIGLDVKDLSHSRIAS